MMMARAGSHGWDCTWVSSLLIGYYNLVIRRGASAPRFSSCARHDSDTRMPLTPAEPLFRQHQIKSLLQAVAQDDRFHQNAARSDCAFVHVRFTDSASTPVTVLAGCRPPSMRFPCSSGQQFAFGFLQIPPCSGTLAVQLTVPPVGPVADLHRQVIQPPRVPE